MNSVHYKVGIRCGFASRWLAKIHLSKSASYLGPFSIELTEVDHDAGDSQSLRLGTETSPHTLQTRPIASNKLFLPKFWSLHRNLFNWRGQLRSNAPLSTGQIPEELHNWQPLSISKFWDVGLIILPS